MKRVLLAMMFGMFTVAALSPPEAPRTEKRVYGWRPPVHSPRFAAEPAPGPREKLPVSHQVTDTGPVLDQGKLGSCGPNAMASALMHAGMPPPSRLFVYYETRVRQDDADTDTGVDNGTMTRAVTEAGFPDEVFWPYEIDTFRDRPPVSAYIQAGLRKGAVFESVPTTVDAVKRRLWANRPVIVGFIVYPSFEDGETEKTGVVRMPAADEYPLGGHDVLIVGWNDVSKTFLFKNSYGTTWGTGGYGSLPYEYLADPGKARDFWALVSLAK